MFRYGVISVPYLLVFGLNTNKGKYGPEITPYLDTFDAVNLTQNIIKETINIEKKIRDGPRWTKK